MNNHNLEILLVDLEDNLPQFLRANDLIRMGLFPTKSALSYAKKRGKAPPHIPVGEHKIVYPRSSLCEWLKEKTEDRQ